MVYVNRTGISHPIQTFSYALKLRLEFTVLNQLMAVAARGIARGRNNFAEKRYHYPTSVDDSSTLKGSKRPENGDFESLEYRPSHTNTDDKSVQISAPSPSFIKPANPAMAPNDPDDELRQHRSASLGRKSNWYPPHMKSPFHNILPQDGHIRKDSDEHEMVPVKVTRKRNGIRRNEQDEPEEETIGVHEWERNGQHMLVVPWFRDSTRDA